MFILQSFRLVIRYVFTKSSIRYNYRSVIIGNSLPIPLYLYVILYFPIYFCNNKFLFLFIEIMCIHNFTCLSNLSIYLSIYLPIYLSIYLSICLSIHPSIYPSIYPWIYLYACIYFRFINVFSLVLSYYFLLHNYFLYILSFNLIGH